MPVFTKDQRAMLSRMHQHVELEADELWKLLRAIAKELEAVKIVLRDKGLVTDVELTKARKQLPMALRTEPSGRAKDSRGSVRRRLR